MRILRNLMESIIQDDFVLTFVRVCVYEVIKDVP